MVESSEIPSKMSREEYELCMKNDTCRETIPKKIQNELSSASTGRSVVNGFSVTTKVLFYILLIGFIGLFGYILYYLFTNIGTIFEGLFSGMLGGIMNTSTT